MAPFEITPDMIVAAADDIRMTVEDCGWIEAKLYAEIALKAAERYLQEPLSDAL